MGVAAEAFLDGTCAVFGAGEGREIGGDAVDDPLANGAGRAASERRIKVVSRRSSLPREHRYPRDRPLNDRAHGGRARPAVELRVTLGAPAAISEGVIPASALGRCSARIARTALLGPFGPLGVCHLANHQIA